MPQDQNERGLEDAVQTVAKAGLDAALRTNKDLRNADGEEVAARLEGLLDDGYALATPASSGAELEVIQDGIEALWEQAQASASEDFYARAFGMNDPEAPTSPRLLRLLLQFALAGVLADTSKPFWTKAALTYLALLKIPGAVSYQMFRASLMRMVLKPLTEAESIEGSSSASLVASLCQVCGARPVMLRCLAANLMPSLIQALLRCGAETSQVHGTVRRAFEQLMEEAADANGNGAEDKLERTARRRRHNDNDDDDDDEGYGTDDGLAAASAEVSQPPATRSLAQAVETEIFKEALRVLKTTKSGKLVDLCAQVLASLISRDNDSAAKADAGKQDEAEATRALKLLEHLCFDVVDKADMRGIAVANVLRVISCTPETARGPTVYRFCKYLSKLSHSSEVPQRSLAAELTSAVLQVCDGDADLLQGLAELLLSRAEDKAPAVRTAAVKGFTGLLDALPFGEAAAPGTKKTAPLVRDAVRSCLHMLRRRLADAKITVRRAAARSMQSFVTHPGVQRTRGLAKLVRRDLLESANRARDVSPAIQNIALHTVSQFYEAFEDPEKEVDAEGKSQDDKTGLGAEVAALWVETVLPLVYAPEQSVQKTARDAIAADIIEPLCKTSDDGDDRVWRLVAAMTQDHVSCLRKCFFDLATESKTKIKVDRLVRKILRAAMDIPDAATALAAWTLLDIVVGGGEEAPGAQGAVQAKARKAVDVELIRAAWDTHFGDRGGAGTDANNDAEAPVELRARVLSVIMGVSASIPAKEATDMAAALFDLVLALDLDTALLRQALLTLVALCLAKAGSESAARQMVGRWGDLIKAQCAKVLREAGKGEMEHVETAQRALFMVGELAILGFDPDDKSRALLPLNDALNTLAMGMLASDDAEAPESADQAVLAALRPAALVATGKICLRDEGTAKKATRMLIRELDQCAQSEVIRSNVIVILGDLCRRYANIVDPYLDVICGCLADPAPLVRRHALILLTGLLQEDYMKWRGVMFARYLMCAADPDEEIRGLVRFALTEIFPSKNPNLFHGKFVDILYGYNLVMTDKYRLCEQFQAPAGAEAEEDLGMLRKARLRYAARVVGRKSACAAARLELYELLLSTMAAPHKLEVTNKLCRDVIGEFLDDKLTLPKNAAGSALAALLEDCFAVLMSPHIEIKAARSDVSELEAGEDLSASTSESVQARMAEAKGKVLSKLERKNFAEHVIPLVISFYRKLQREQSPHLRLAISYLIKMKKAFPEEFDLSLGADKNLAQELDYDISQQEKENARRAERENEKLAKKRRRSLAVAEAADAAASPAKRVRPSTAKKARLVAPGTASRRVSVVTWQPSARDVAARTATGVLKTPIPKSHTKKKNRRKSLLQEMNLGASSAPRRLERSAAKENQGGANESGTPQRKTLTFKSSEMLSAAPPATVATMRRRKWSLTPSLATTGSKGSNDLTKQLMEMGDAE